MAAKRTQRHQDRTSDDANPDRRTARQRAAVLSLVLVAFHTALTVPSLPGALQTLLNVSVAGAVIFVAERLLHLTADDLGFVGKHGRAFFVGAGVAALILAPLAALVAFHVSVSVLKDVRYHIGPGQLAFVLLVRIPIQTVLVEEVAFRGVMFAILEPVGRRTQVIWTSIAFGLWHVGPALALLAHTPNISAQPQLLAPS